jgi:hypothetical protein
MARERIRYFRRASSTKKKDYRNPSSAKAKKRVELYLYSPFGPSWPFLGRTLPFTFTSINEVLKNKFAIKH